MKQVLILGATSDMAKAAATLYAQKGLSLTLACRKSERIRNFVSDLRLSYGIVCEAVDFDAVDFGTHQIFYHKIPKPDIVLLFFGYLGDNKLAESNWAETEKIIDQNYKGAVSILNIIANDMEARKTGTIVGVSSVAGERGRQSNYIYGSAKAALTAYLSGLRNRLAAHDVHVVTIKPGFIATQMTEGLKLPPLITGKPIDIAKAIDRSVKHKKNIVYVLPIWRYIMMIIKNIPENIFKKLKL